MNADHVYLHITLINIGYGESFFMTLINIRDVLHFPQIQFAENICRISISTFPSISAKVFFNFNFSTNSNCRIFFHNLRFVEFAKVPNVHQNFKFAEFGGTWNFRSVLGSKVSKAKQIKRRQARNQRLLVRVYIWKQRKKICIPTRGRSTNTINRHISEEKVMRFGILKYYGGHCKQSRSRGMSCLANQNSLLNCLSDNMFPEGCFESTLCVLFSTIPSHFQTTVAKNAAAVIKSSCIRGSSCSKRTIPS